MTTRSYAGPLAGIRVIDLGLFVAGPFAATLLADYGADVVKVERPGKGDPLRALGHQKDGMSLWWQACNRNKRTIALGGTTLELHHTGRNHSDSSLVMFLPKEKIIFAVDFNSLGSVPSRLAVNDSYPVEWEASLKKTLALNWERQIPGHPGPGGRLGTKKDMEQQLAFMSDLSNEVKKASDAGKCFSPADAEVKLPQHSTLQGYEQNLPWNIHRWCGFWGRGI